MTKQEKVFYILQDVRLDNLSEYEATLKLQELGVVIKVNKDDTVGMVAVEPLIAEPLIKEFNENSN